MDWEEGSGERRKEKKIGKGKRREGKKFLTLPGFRMLFFSGDVTARPLDSSF